MTEKYILVSDEEYCYTLNTQSEHYKTLEDFEKQELENAKKDNVDINEYEDKILQLANDNYWDWIYNNHLEADDVNDIINTLTDENKQLKQFKEDVFNKIDMHLRILPTTRDAEFNEEYGDPSLYTGAIYMLETLKKELQE